MKKINLLTNSTLNKKLYTKWFDQGKDFLCINHAYTIIDTEVYAELSKNVNYFSTPLFPHHHHLSYIWDTFVVKNIILTAGMWMDILNREKSIANIQKEWGTKYQNGCRICISSVQGLLRQHRWTRNLKRAPHVMNSLHMHS